MKALLEAIYKQYTDEDVSSDLRGAVTHFHFGQASADHDLPIVTYNIVGGSTDYSIASGAEEIETYSVQFSIFTETYIEGMDIYDAIGTAYQSKILPFSVGTCLICTRQSMVGPVIMDDAFQITTDYEIMYHLP